MSGVNYSEIKVGLWVCVEETPHAMLTHIFHSEGEAYGWALTWCAARWSDDLGAMPESWTDAYEMLNLDFEGIHIDEHSVAAEAFVSYDDAWRSVSAPDTSMGVLYDPDEVRTALDGHDGFCHEKHSPAVEEWCRREKLAMQDAFSSVFWANAPSTQELDKILVELEWAQ